MKISIFLFLLISSYAHADLYKCANSDGKPSYQDQPCGKADSPLQIKIHEHESMAGCYEFNERRSIERWEIRAIANGDFEWLMIDNKGKREITRPISLKRATPEEVLYMSREFHYDLKQGVSFKTDDKKLAGMGIYMGKNENGEGVTMAAVLYGGFLKKNSCP